jgi:hypothetical protein
MKATDRADDLFAFLQNCALALLTRAEDYLRSRAPVLAAATRAITPGAESDQDQLLLARELDAVLSAPCKEEEQERYVLEFPLFLLSTLATASMVSILEVLGNRCDSPQAISIATRQLPFPCGQGSPHWDRWQSFRVVVVAQDRAVGAAMGKLCQMLSKLRTKPGVTYRTTLYHLKILHLEQLRGWSFWEKVLQDYYADPWPFFGWDDTDSMEIMDLSALEERKLCLAHIAEQERLGRKPTFFKYDGIGDSADGVPKPMELAVLVRMLQCLKEQDGDKFLGLQRDLVSLRRQNEGAQSHPSWSLDENNVAPVFFETEGAFTAIEKHVPGGGDFIRFLRNCILERKLLVDELRQSPSFDPSMVLGSPQIRGTEVMMT